MVGGKRVPEGMELGKGVGAGDNQNTLYPCIHLSKDTLKFILDNKFQNIHFFKTYLQYQEREILISGFQSAGVKQY